jgi:hypothetical protein
MSVVKKDAMDDLRKSAIGLMGVVFRFFLFLLLM